MDAVLIRNEVCFILNDEEVVLRDCAPGETLLDWLRLKKRLTGTKEGCAEGDCGACTVLVGRLAEGRLVYESINACIRFIATLDATHVVTIEHLKKPDGTLHPVQQAMVDLDGSQCGFCTPGIVMSLYGLWMRSPEASDAEIEKALQGNLCRCTGYEAIMRAARAVSAYGTVAADRLTTEREAIQRRLGELADQKRIELKNGESRFIAPASAQDLAQIYEAMPEATIVAGSTDVGLWVTKQLRDISPILFIGGIEELKRISVTDKAVTIGAGVSYSEAAVVMLEHFPALGLLLDRVGGAQVRNMGTIGGNIANGSPIGDMPPPLIGLEASLTLRKGEARRMMALEDFFVAYGKQDRQKGEFVESVSIPLLAPNNRFAVYKVSKRRDEDISAVLGTFRLSLSPKGMVETIRIAFGGMAGTPRRAKNVEAALVGKAWSEAAVENALVAFEADFSPLTDWRASADYRMLVAKNLLRRFLAETTGAHETAPKAVKL